MRIAAAVAAADLSVMRSFTPQCGHLLSWLLAGHAHAGQLTKSAMCFRLRVALEGVNARRFGYVHPHPYLYPRSYSLPNEQGGEAGREPRRAERPG